MRGVFADPSAFTQRATALVVGALASRAKGAHARGNRAACLDAARRLEALAPGHPAIAKLRRFARSRTLVFGLALAGCGLATGLAFMISTTRRTSSPTNAQAQVQATLGVEALLASMSRPGRYMPPAPTASVASASAPALRAAKATARPISKPQPAAGDLRGDAGAEASPTIALLVSPANSWVQIDGATWRQLPGGRVALPWLGQPIRVEGRNETCCENAQRTLRLGDVGTTVGLALSFLPARVIPLCERAGVAAQINGRPARLGAANIIAFGDSTQPRQTVTVEFIGDKVTSKRVSVRANETVTVPCAATPP